MNFSSVILFTIHLKRSYYTQLRTKLRKSYVV